MPHSTHSKKKFSSLKEGFFYKQILDFHWPFHNFMPQIAIMKFCQNHWPPPQRSRVIALPKFYATHPNYKIFIKITGPYCRDLVSQPFQNFMPHIAIMEFCQNHWSLLQRSGVIALPKFYATHRNYEILSKSLAPTVEIWCHSPSKILCHTSKL